MKRTTIGLLTLLIALFPGGGVARQNSTEAPAGKAADAGNSWMRKLDGGMSIAQLSIPGTHDSGALYEPVPGTTKCQNLSIAEQLNAGVRFLDIRCRHIHSGFTIHHGPVYQNQNFDDVFGATSKFLKDNPGETVLMSVKEEYDASDNKESFEQTFAKYVAKNPGLWYLGARIPTLFQARGKIVLIRRFGASTVPLGIDASVWPDNTTFSVGPTLRVQDNYQVSTDGTKWGQIRQMLNEANTGPSSTLYLNFASGYRSGPFGIPNIPSVSETIDPDLTSYFSSNTGARCGVIIMDFVTPNLCSLVYKHQKP